ncbi:hypothetical protein SLA2020_265370 [Shorea laevis]
MINMRSNGVISCLSVFFVSGPVISKFITAFRELATHKEFLRSQVEHVLIDRLMHFMTVDLEDAKVDSCSCISVMKITFLVVDTGFAT